MIKKQCSAKSCLHSSRDIPLGEEVKDRRNKCYHSDCLHASQCLTEAKSAYFQYDDTVPMPQLVSVLNNIFFKQKVDPDFALYAIKQSLKEKRVKYPYGLYYAVKNNQLQEQFDRAKLKVIRANINTENEKECVNPVEVGSKDTYTPPKFMGFGAIFRGGR